jgi:hypothetical protein
MIAWVAAGMLTACVSLSNRSPAVRDDTVRPALAILPMSATDVQISVDDPATQPTRAVEVGWAAIEPGEFLRSANGTLDHLAGTGRTIGPARCSTLLAPRGLDQQLRVALADPDPAAAAWKQDVFVDATRVLGVDRVVLIRMTAVCSAAVVTPPHLGSTSEGTVQVTARLVEWPAGRELGRATGSKEFKFKMGVAVVGGPGAPGAAIMWPYAIGKPASEAFADAARAALLGLSPFGKGQGSP